MLEAVATANLILGLIGFFWLLARTATRRHEYPTEVHLLLYLALGLFFALLVTSLSLLLAGGTTWNVAVISVVKIFALVVLCRTRTTKYRTGTRQSDGDPGADENKDVDG